MRPDRSASVAGEQAHVLGDATVVRVVERRGPGFMPAHLFPDWRPADLDEHRGWLAPDCYDEASGRLISSVHAWVVRTARRTILVDPCVGNGKLRPGFAAFQGLSTDFLGRLAAAGVRPEAVDWVLCTHLHADHCGWNTRLRDGRWVPTFPNATYVFSEAERAHWSGPAGRTGVHAGVFEDSVRPVIAAGQAWVVDGPATVGDGLRLVPTPGHSPGHLAAVLEADGQCALFCGDLLHHPVQVRRPAWNSRFCADADAARASRRWALDPAADTGAVLFTGHFAGSSAGRVGRRSGGFGWRFA